MLAWRVRDVMFAACAFVAVSVASGQPFEPTNGPRQVDPGWHAITGATVVTSPGSELENATLVVRHGVIVSIEAGAEAPAGARVWDARGLRIYPGLIEPFVEVSVPAPDTGAPGSHWNASVAAQRRALDGAGLSASDRQRLRSMGFVVAHLAPNDGLLRGQTAVVALGESQTVSDPTARVIHGSLWHAASLRRGNLGEGYPSSKMGAIALVRQTLADAQWWPEAVRAHEQRPDRVGRPAPNDAVATLADSRGLLFIVDDELDLLRTARLAGEFGRDAVFVGNGTELRRLDAIASLGRPLITSVSLPMKPRVESISDQNAVSLRDLMFWEQAPTNLRRLREAGVATAITSSRLRRGENFYDNLRSAIRHGLSEDDALAMLTLAPAAMLGIDSRYGTLEPGKQASFVVVEGSLFDSSSKIRSVWTDGQRHEINADPQTTLNGEYAVGFDLDGQPVSFRVEPDRRGLKVTYVIAAGGEPRAEDGEDAKPRQMQARSVERNGNRLSMLVDASLFGASETGTATVRLAFDGERVLGVASLTGAREVRFSAQRQSVGGDDAKKDEKPETPDVPERLALPLGAFAYEDMPLQEPVVIFNATIWTNTDEGTIENGYVVFRDGKIERVGSGQPPALPRIYRWIDAEGRHVTPGMIDCHSHTGISGGVNEGTQAVTAEVAIADVIDPDDINWYRQLAGGVTAVSQLHGSANPIGGQNSVVKLRWGAAHPDDMRMEGAPSGIKFALGENVKQSNWGDRNTTRYPQTRMGVETIIVDRFIAAREYAARRDQARLDGEPFRIDYELEIISEILAGERLIHCHSYRQDEILMLCRVAEDFGITIGSFQHVLEGYKVADAIKAHSLGASSFSDWWAFKFEVIDGVPYNGAIMHEVGVVVSYNSDSNEVARRLNTEAAKAVKYGRVPEEEALKFVTLNVAKQLKIEDRVGAIAPGMDADLAVWTGHPLSSLSRCERTFVDGREMFSLERDAELRAQMVAERDRIIQKLIADKNSRPSSRATEEEQTEAQRAMELLASGGASPAEMIAAYRLVRQLAAIEEQQFFMMRNGIDPTSRPGDCGCDEQLLFSFTR